MGNKVMPSVEALKRITIAPTLSPVSGGGASCLHYIIRGYE